MAGLIREGFWIPLLFLACAIIYAVWVIYRSLDRLRDRGRINQEGLGDLLLHFRVGLERIQRASSWIEEGNLDAAVRELNEVQRLYPGLHTAHYFLGKAFLVQGEGSLAREHFQVFLDKTSPCDRVSRERTEEVRAMLKDLV